MLKRLEVENFRIFKTKTVFDLSETKNYEFNSECIKNGLIKNAMIYGKNGCGKSNLGLATFDLVSHLTDKSSPKSTPGIFSTNYLHAELPNETAKFKYEFKFDESTVEYYYEKKSIGELTLESLRINGVEVVYFKVGDPLITKLKGAESLKPDISESKISALKYIKSNAVLDDDDTNKAFHKFLDFVDNMLFFRSVDGHMYIGYENGSTEITQYIIEKGLVSDFEKLLNEVGIDCTLSTIETNGIKMLGFSFKNAHVDFWSIASTGTRSLTLFYYWIQHKASLIFIDEFDANYHFTLSARLVNILKKNNAQVILTTHDTTVMSNDLVRPDCCFLMENNKITPFSNLTDKELRFAHNIEKMYKAGAFGG